MNMDNNRQLIGTLNHELGEQQKPKSLLDYLDDVRQALPVVDSVLSEHGDKTIAEYLETQNQFSAASFQPRDDLAEVVYNYAKPLLGEVVARDAADELLANPVVLTANHHGVDYFAQSVQGTLIFSLRKINGKRAKTVPVFACGNIPLNNVTYPRGALIYPSYFSANKNLQSRVPLFPSKNRRDSVCTVRPYNKMDFLAFKNNLFKSIHPEYKIDVEKIINEIYEPALDEISYSDQSVKTNALIWDKLLINCPFSPKLVYLELERIASELLKIDLNSIESLFSLLCINRSARKMLFTVLKGKKNCWDIDFDNEGNIAKCIGTFLFWGVDKKGRRIALFEKYSDGKDYLCGRSDTGENFSIELNPEKLTEALKNHEVIPSLFCSYLVINMARGVTGLGGYYQADYLPVMKNGVTDVMKEIYNDIDLSIIDAVKTNGYLSGMQVVNQELGAELLPVGPLEMIIHGGLSEDSYNSLDQANVVQSHMYSLIETIFDVLPVKADMDFIKNNISEMLYIKENSSF